MAGLATRPRQLRTDHDSNAEPVAKLLLPRWSFFLLIFGVYLTARGYHAFDGDQAYRLPILLHAQNPAVYQSDPFVRGFDTFNPHLGYLGLLRFANFPLGLSSALAILFGLTLIATSIGVDRFARSVWPESGRKVGLVALVLVLLAKAGNIGTNHLYESTLLDRLIGFAMGWLALSACVANPKRCLIRSACWVGLAAWVHPSVGLQLALTLAVSWVFWAMRQGRTEVTARDAGLAILGLGIALIPGLALMIGQGGRLFTGLPVEEFRQLAVLVQGPQHMLPSTWRTPQWLAWACYPTLALLAFARTTNFPSPPWPAARWRMAMLMVVNLASLGAAYLAIEVVGDLRVTLFQPFRMATLARGLALVAVSGRVLALWNRGDFPGRARALLIAVGLSADWTLVVATMVDGIMFLCERMTANESVTNAVGAVLLILGLGFLTRHDTESGQAPLTLALGVLVVGTLLARFRTLCWTPRRMAWALLVAWFVPISALGVGGLMARPDRYAWSEALVARCRFAEVPTDDIERLAVWCRDHTEPSAIFVTPPGPKDFRLWSRRSVAFNRASSPYHAAGLGDWAARYRDHVAFEGSTPAFVQAYLNDRHALEARYGQMTDIEKAALARRQGANYIVAAAPASLKNSDTAGPLKLLRIEGRYAVYVVKSETKD